METSPQILVATDVATDGSLVVDADAAGEFEREVARFKTDRVTRP